MKLLFTLLFAGGSLGIVVNAKLAADRRGSPRIVVQSRYHESGRTTRNDRYYHHDDKNEERRPTMEQEGSPKYHLPRAAARFEAETEAGERRLQQSNNKNGASSTMSPTSSPAPTWSGGCDEPHNFFLDECIRQYFKPTVSSVAWDTLQNVGYLWVALGSVGQFFVMLVVAALMIYSIFLARARAKRRGSPMLGDGLLVVADGDHHDSSHAL